MIASFAVSLVAVAGFALCLALAGIAKVALRVLPVASAGLSAMMDPGLDDDAKEAALRRAGLDLLLSAFGLFWRFGLALGVAFLPIEAADALGLASRDEVLSLMLGLDYIVFVSLALIGLAAVFRPGRTPVRTRAEQRSYTAVDRFFHELAFSSPAVLKGASWIEDRIVRSRESEAARAPVFVTSIARAGTTALVNGLYRVPGMATHIYRDMPFLTAPTLWYRLSGGRSRRVERHERAHGDGLEIDLDTPEAFEEVIWKLCWPDKYQPQGIALWQSGDRNPKAEDFLRHHMEKIVQARRRQGRLRASARMRYFSKNNTNIGRLPFLAEAFPDCAIVVPVRRPECHVASLLRQHRNFLKLHAQDDFIRRYMRDIGHFEFGQIHRPILFPGVGTGLRNPAEPDYWLEYWIHAFRYALAHQEVCTFVLQDDLRAAPRNTMAALCAALRIDPRDLTFEGVFRNEPDVADASDLDPSLLQEARELYEALEHVALR